jgi:PIN domain nuclease of toxin-antitoxin system
MPAEQPTGRVLVDTHALLWWKAGSDRLVRSARRRLDRAEVVLVSAISCWEVGMLERKGRIALDRPVAAWCNDLFAPSGRLRPVPVTHDVAVAAALLEDFHGDPADRILVATAVEEGVPLVTKDDRLHAYADRSGTLDARW